MTIVKASNLTGAALDWAVAKCEGNLITFDRYGPSGQWEMYSTNWAQGGPIIDRNEIGIRRNAPCSHGREWEASPSVTAKGAGGRYGYGPTPLIAAMRCYVASKLGDIVDVPEELL